MSHRRSEPVMVPPAEGAVWQVLGDAVVCKISGDQTGGAYAVVETATPPGGGPPLHLHGREDEFFYVLDGRLDIRCGNRTFTLEAGACAHLPRGVPHTFRNVGDALARMLVTLVPAGFERFFAQVDRLGRHGVPNMDEVAALAGEFGLAFIAAETRAPG